MPRTTTKQRVKAVVLGRCEFCRCDIDVQVMAGSSLLTPFGECARCHRFTIWTEVDASAIGLWTGLPRQRRAS